MAEISMNGVGGTAYVTMNKKPSDTLAVGMAVTLTGANEVGLGVAGGSPVFGIISHVEKEGDVVGVQTSGFNDAVTMTATTANQPATGSLFACNNKGELIKVETAPAGNRGFITAIDTASIKATVLL